MTSASLFSCRDVSISFGGTKALDGISLDIWPGEVVGLIGPNGSGKSTFINVVSGYYPLDDGTMSLSGSSLVGTKAWRRRRLGLSRTFQSLRLYEDLTVLENVLLGLHPELQSFGSAVASLAKLPSARRREFESRHRCELALAEAGVETDLDRRLGDLSYGTRKRVEIARANVVNPTLLLLDEPTAGLSPEEADELLPVLQRSAKAHGQGVLLVEHRLDWVIRVCDRIAVLDAGRLVATAAADQIMSLPEVVKAYVGS